MEIYKSAGILGFVNVYGQAQKSAKEFLFYFVLHHKCNNFGCVNFLFLQQQHFLMIAAIWENI